MGFICPKDGCNDEVATSRGLKSHHYLKHGEKIGLIEVECHHCGDVFERHKSEVERNGRQFCDNECFGRWQSNHQKGENNPLWKGGKKNEHSCTYCGESYSNYLSDSETKFCSRDCYSKWMSEERVGDKSYAWKGGYENYYGPSWQRARRKALSSSDYKCEECGICNKKHEEQFGQELHVHHVEKFRSFGLENHREANKQSNLMVVCKDCHYKVEP